MLVSAKLKLALIVLVLGGLLCAFYTLYSSQEVVDLKRFEGLLLDEEFGLYGGVDNTVAMEADEGVIFLKTHKTGGTTLANILWRNLCEPVTTSNGSSKLESHARKGRNCFLSPVEHPGKTWDFQLSSHWDLLERQGGSSLYGRAGMPPYEVWLSHAKFHDSLLIRLVPTARRIISIVRDPVSRFKSAWNWYQHEKTVGMSMAQYVSMVERGRSVPALEYRKGLDATIEELVGHEGFSSSSGKTAVDTRGLDLLVDGLVERVRSGKLLLLVTDRFDESMLVLSKLMRWESLGQLAYIRLKDRRSGTAYRSDRLGHSGLVPKEDPVLDARIAALQPYDSFVYKLANRVLNNLLAAWFPDANALALSLRQLEEANARLADKCARGGAEREYFMGTPCHCFVRDNNHTTRSTWAALQRTQHPDIAPLHCTRLESRQR